MIQRYDSYRLAQHAALRKTLVEFRLRTWRQNIFSMPDHVVATEYLIQKWWWTAAVATTTSHVIAWGRLVLVQYQCMAVTDTYPYWRNNQYNHKRDIDDILSKSTDLNSILNHHRWVVHHHHRHHHQC